MIKLMVTGCNGTIIDPNEMNLNNVHYANATFIVIVNHSTLSVPLHGLNHQQQITTSML